LNFYITGIKLYYYRDKGKKEEKKMKKIISIYIEKIERKENLFLASQEIITHYIRNLCIKKILDII